jgi:hypothetical protein
MNPGSISHDPVFNQDGIFFLRDLGTVGQELTIVCFLRGEEPFRLGTRSELVLGPDMRVDYKIDYDPDHYADSRASKKC